MPRFTVIPAVHRRFNTGYEDEQRPDGMVPYVRAAIDHYRRGVAFSELGWGGAAPAR